MSTRNTPLLLPKMTPDYIIKWCKWLLMKSINKYTKCRIFVGFPYSYDGFCLCIGVKSLTHWGRDQIDTISQTTFPNAFSRMKMNEFRLGFHWSLFSPRISLKFVPKVRINNIPALVQIMAWRRPGDKPLSEPMMASILTHICVTRPQWVKETTHLWKVNIKSKKRHIYIPPNHWIILSNWNMNVLFWGQKNGANKLLRQIVEATT